MSRLKLPIANCLIAGLLVAFVLFGAGCRKGGPPANANNVPPQHAPPFVAKEPQQYRAKRVTIFTDDAGKPSQPYESAIARDGLRRRSDFTTGESRLSLIERPEGNIVLRHERSAFARLNAEETADVSRLNEAQEADLSPERLLHQSDFETEFRRVRVEQVTGRSTTVYQVLFRTGGGQTESWIWIDDETGFPLKNEYFQSIDGVRRGPGQVTEIRDLLLGPPPPEWFDIPANFREVSIQEIWRLPAATK